MTLNWTSLNAMISHSVQFHLRWSASGIQVEFKRNSFETHLKQKGNPLNSPWKSRHSYRWHLRNACWMNARSLKKTRKCAFITWRTRHFSRLSKTTYFQGRFQGETDFLPPLSYYRAFPILFRNFTPAPTQNHQEKKRISMLILLSKIAIFQRIMGRGCDLETNDSVWVRELKLENNIGKAR